MVWDVWSPCCLRLQEHRILLLQLTSSPVPQQGASQLQTAEEEGEEEKDGDDDDVIITVRHEDVQVDEARSRLSCETETVFLLIIIKSIQCI